MAAPATAQEIKKLKQGFPQQAMICLAVMAAIHILPKSAEAGPALEQTWKMYLAALNRFCNMMSMVLLVFMGANAVKVLSKWMSVFDVFSPVAALAWWGSLAAILLFSIWGRSYLSDVMQKRRLLEES